MLSRRLIRIKAFKTLFAYEGSHADNALVAQKTLVESCDKVKDLYYFMLNISSSLIRVAEDKIAAGMQKFRPTEEEAHPNLKFVHNRFAALLSDDPEFGRYCMRRGLQWGGIRALRQACIQLPDNQGLFPELHAVRPGFLRGGLPVVLLHLPG